MALAELAPFEAPTVSMDGSPADLQWSGFLTVENVEHVAERLREQFAGRWLVITTVYEYKQWEPEVHAPVRIDARDGGERGVRVANLSDLHVSVGFSAGHYVWGIGGWRMAKQPRFRLFEPEGSGPPRDVLAWIDEVGARWGQPHLEFTDRSLLVKDRAPNALAYWWRIDLLEHPGTLNVVLEAEEAAVAHLAAEVSEVEVPRRGAAFAGLREHVERVFGGPEQARRWLP